MTTKGTPGALRHQLRKERRANAELRRKVRQLTAANDTISRTCANLHIQGGKLLADLEGARAVADEGAEAIREIQRGAAEMRGARDAMRARAVQAEERLEQLGAKAAALAALVDVVTSPEGQAAAIRTQLRTVAEFLCK